MAEGVSILAQQSPGRLIVAVLLLIGVTIVGGVVILAIRRRATADQTTTALESLSLGELRDMHARGQITDEEYEALRAAALGAFGYAENAERRTASPGVDLTGDPLPGTEPDQGDDASGNRGPA
ncbi:MAG: SHOCT domain-containing protein [Phycisphaerales bacterium]